MLISAPTKDRNKIGKTDAAGSYSYSFPVEVGDSGDVKVVMHWVPNDPVWAECSAHYTAT